MSNPTTPLRGAAGLAFVRRPSVGPSLRFGASPAGPRAFGAGVSRRLPVSGNGTIWPEDQMETRMTTPTFDPVAAVDRLASLWRADSGASPAAFAILRIALTGQGSVSADDLWRLDARNRAAALGLLGYALALGYDAAPAPEGLRETIYAKAHNAQTAHG